MATAAPLILQAGDHARLVALVRSASARPSLVQRARIVLMSAEGLTNTEIARRTGSTRPTVINWRNRYAAAGISALGDLPRTGRPPVVDELEVVATTLADGGRPPAHLGVDHWSSRSLGSGASGASSRITSRRSPSALTSPAKPRSATSVGSTSTYPNELRRCPDKSQPAPLKDRRQVSPIRGSSSSRSRSAS